MVFVQDEGGIIEINREEDIAKYYGADEDYLHTGKIWLSRSAESVFSNITASVDNSASKRLHLYAFKSENPDDAGKQCITLSKMLLGSGYRLLGLRKPSAAHAEFMNDVSRSDNAILLINQRSISECAQDNPTGCGRIIKEFMRSVSESGNPVKIILSVNRDVYSEIYPDDKENGPSAETAIDEKSLGRKHLNILSTGFFLLSAAFILAISEAVASYLIRYADAYSVSLYQLYINLVPSAMFVFSLAGEALVLFSSRRNTKRELTFMFIAVALIIADSLLVMVFQNVWVGPVAGTQTGGALEGWNLYVIVLLIVIEFLPAVAYFLFPLKNSGNRVKSLLVLSLLFSAAFLAYYYSQGIRIFSGGFPKTYPLIRSDNSQLYS